MLSRVFIDRPIFAWVLAIIVMMAGIAGLILMPRAQYPDIAPVQVTIRANYPGASAQTVESSVTQIIEQSLTGIDGLLYFSSSSARNSTTVTVTFDKGIDPDTAQVQIQNQVQQIVSRLPAQVQQQGLVVRKANPDEVLLVSVYDESDRLSSRDVADYLTTNLQDPLSRVPGVGDTDVFGSPYAMRIWLDPDKLASFRLNPEDVAAAIRSQNTEVASGEVGGMPQPSANRLNAIITAQSRLQTAEEFRAIVVKTTVSGGVVRIGDVARVELGSENYSMSSRINGHPGAGMAIRPAPGADVLVTADLVKAEVTRLSASFPSGLTVRFANDVSPFIRQSISEVVKTLLEAVVLVVLVMFLFLQSWRATLIPAIAVPVVILGTFAILYAAGFSINTMTLFGLVLAIGLLVDDAIVVVENVERLMHENPGMSARDATIESMHEINVALIAIALVLSAVFIPMALFGGSLGVIYRQFSLTIVSAMVLSVLVALILSPALAASVLKPRAAAGEAPDNRMSRTFPGFTARLAAAGRRLSAIEHKGTERYVALTAAVIDRRWPALGAYLLLVVLLGVLFVRLPTGFLPNEDQGRALVQFRLPSGATFGQTEEVGSRIEQYFRENESDTISALFIFVGSGGQNTGNAYMNLRDWSERTDPSASVDAVVARAAQAFRGFRDAQAFPLVLPPVRGLGMSNGFTMQLLNSSGMPDAQFRDVRDRLVEAAAADPLLASVRLSELPSLPQLRLDMDPEALSTLGLTQAEANATLSTAFGGTYVNDFIDRGRVKRVYLQGDMQFRDAPEDFDQWSVRGASGEMTPFSAFARLSWSLTPSSLPRFNGLPAAEFNGTAAPGVSSGQAMQRMEELASAVPGVTVAWSGLSYQERLSSGRAPLLYALALVVVFLCLAALYESWSIPFAVLLVIPLGLLGSVLAVTLRGLVNDIYLQIGLLMTMGLAAKNAILIVEFAELAERQGRSPLEAALEAARLRIRPILMTSAAFIFGVMPLALATGVGANSRIAIGTAVVGGMLSATLLAIFYIPLFYVLVRHAALRAGRLFSRQVPQPEAG